METPEIIILAIVVVVGLPSATWNPTAAALVISWMVGEAVYLITGNNLPVEIYLFPDIFVVGVIFAKTDYQPCDSYVSTWHQLKCLILERSPADRAVLAIFAIMWPTYISGLHDFYKWWILYGCVILQFLFASAEAIAMSRRSRSMSVGKATPHNEPPSSEGSFFDRIVTPQVGLFPINANSSVPAFGDLPYPGYARSVRSSPLVSKINRWTAITQVRDAVIRCVSVNMVDMLRRPSAVVERPNKAMGVKLAPEKSGAPVTPVAGSCSLSSRMSAVPDPPIPATAASKHLLFPRKPKQLARFRLITEKLTQRFWARYFLSSQCADPSRGGQGRALFPQRFRPEFSDTNQADFQHRAGAVSARRDDKSRHEFSRLAWGRGYV